MFLKKINSAKSTLVYLFGYALGLPLGYYAFKAIDLWLF